MHSVHVTSALNTWMHDPEGMFKTLNGKMTIYLIYG